MAKRTPRSEADDSVTAAPARPSRPRPRGGRETGDEAASNAAETTDTFAARTGGDAADDVQSEGGRSKADALTNPSEEEIRIRAYELYLERGGGHGMHFDDWLRAEDELKNRR